MLHQAITLDSDATCKKLKNIGTACSAALREKSAITWQAKSQVVSRSELSIHARICLYIFHRRPILSRLIWFLQDPDSWNQPKLNQSAAPQ